MKYNGPPTSTNASWRRNQRKKRRRQLAQLKGPAQPEPRLTNHERRRFVRALVTQSIDADHQTTQLIEAAKAAFGRRKT